MIILSHARITNKNGARASYPFISDNNSELMVLNDSGELTRTIKYSEVKNWSGVEISSRQFKRLISNSKNN